MPSKLTRRASSTYVGLVQSAAHSLALHYFCSRIYRNQTWILQLGSVRLQNVCHSSPTVDSFTIPVIVGTPQLGWYWTFPSLGESVQPCVICYTGYLCIYGGASRSKSVCLSATVSTGQHRYIYRRSAIQSTQMYIDHDFALLTTATWSCCAPTLTDSVGAVFCVWAEPVEQATTSHLESVR